MDGYSVVRVFSTCQTSIGYEVVRNSDGQTMTEPQWINNHGGSHHKAKERVKEVFKYHMEQGQYN